MLHDFLLVLVAVSVSSFFTIVCVGSLKLDLVKYIESIEATLQETWEMILKVARKNR